MKFSYLILTNSSPAQAAQKTKQLQHQLFLCWELQGRWHRARRSLGSLPSTLANGKDGFSSSELRYLPKTVKITDRNSNKGGRACQQWAQPWRWHWSRAFHSGHQFWIPLPGLALQRTYLFVSQMPAWLTDVYEFHQKDEGRLMIYFIWVFLLPF